MRICPLLLSLVGLRRYRDARSRHTASVVRLGAEADRLKLLGAPDRYGDNFDDTMRRIAEAAGK